MKLVSQRPCSNMCGHACVAMLANTTPDRVAQVLRHDRCTTWRELYSLLFSFGVVCEPELTPAFFLEGMPEVAVVILPTVCTTLKHAVVKWGDEIYDPASGIYMADGLPFSAKASELIKYAAVKNMRCTG